MLVCPGPESMAQSLAPSLTACVHMQHAKVKFISLTGICLDKVSV